MISLLIIINNYVAMPLYVATKTCTMKLVTWHNLDFRFAHCSMESGEEKRFLLLFGL